MNYIGGKTGIYYTGVQPVDVEFLGIGEWKDQSKSFISRGEMSGSEAEHLTV